MSNNIGGTPLTSQQSQNAYELDEFIDNIAENKKHSREEAIKIAYDLGWKHGYSIREAEADLE